MEKQKIMYDSGNELAAYAAKQINYHVMGYYPITPSTQIAENLDVMRAEGQHDIQLIAAEGEPVSATARPPEAAGSLTRQAQTVCSMHWSSFPCSPAHGCPW